MSSARGRSSAITGERRGPGGQRAGEPSAHHAVVDTPAEWPATDASTAATLLTHAFICGCPRSGTSALSLLLNAHPNVAIGFERFKRVRGFLEPFHFAPEVFCNPVPTETDILAPRFYEHLAAKFERGSVTVVGDKLPLYTDALGHLGEAFPGCRVVFTVRELEPTAASFRARASDPNDVWAEANDDTAAPTFWNDALRAARQFESEGNGEQLLLVPSEELFDGSRPWLHALLEFLDLPPSSGVVRAYDEMVASAGERARSLNRRLTAAQRKAVLSHRDEELDSWWRQRVGQQLNNSHPDAKQRGGKPVIPSNVEATPLPRRVQDQLFEALTHPPKAGDQLTELERRATAQMREIAERGKQLKTLEDELTTARRDLTGSLHAREELAVQVREVAAQSAATRERLTSQLAESESELTMTQRRAEDRFAHVHRELHRVERELETAAKQAEQLRALVAQREQARDALLEHLAERDRQVSQRDRELAERTRSLAALGEESARLKEELAQTEVLLEETRGERDRARARIKTELEMARAHREELEAALIERERAEVEVRDELAATTTEFTRRLASRADELKVAAHHLAALEATTAALHQAFEEMQARASETRAERARLREQVDMLSRHNAGLDRAQLDAERRVRDLSGHLYELEQDLKRRGQRVKSLQHEVTVANARQHALEREREQIAADVGRAAASRAWRWGHAVTTFLATVTFRRKSKRGALDVLAEQLEPYARPLAHESEPETPPGES